MHCKCRCEEIYQDMIWLPQLIPCSRHFVFTFLAWTLSSYHHYHAIKVAIYPNVRNTMYKPLSNQVIFRLSAKKRLSIKYHWIQHLALSRLWVLPQFFCICKVKRSVRIEGLRALGATAPQASLNLRRIVTPLRNDPELPLDCET